jgi:colanic acid biosynthesis glycosyl transferase WcaI
MVCHLLTRPRLTLRIGVLSQWFSPETGAAAVPGVLARALAERGHDIQVLTGFPNYPDGKLASGYRVQRRLDEHGGPGVAIRRVALYPSHSSTIGGRFLNFSSFALSASLSGVNVLRDMDAIWVYNSPATVGLPSLLASAHNGPPHLMHIMDLWPDSILFSGLVKGRTYDAAARILGAWCDLTYRRASAIACTTEGAVNLLIQRGVPETKLHYIPVWTDESVYFPRPYDLELAEDLHVTGDFTILYAGNLGGAQGLEHFLEVCYRVRDLTGLKVLIAGSGTSDFELRRQANSMQLENVQFLGRWPTEDMGRLLSISDLNLVSLRDTPLAAITMPSKLPAILASGRAVLARANGEVARIVRESGAGFVAKQDNVAGLENAVREAYAAGKESMARMGSMGSSYYRRHLSLNKSAGSVEALLQNIAESSQMNQSAIRKKTLCQVIARPDLV